MPEYHVYMTVKNQECYVVEADCEKEAIEIVENGDGTYNWTEHAIEAEVTHAEEVKEEEDVV
ncbi:hypothetical protein KNU84_gp035 [Bacteriophage DSS3_VP1]|uniref:Uncharacterized protein n=1 Tax=Bacteriophage DSS3_VP1 TaxID=2664196 RepID=A0A7S5FQD5_9CAUD|nr:hypothetical protein KNU84_gp035 [Bacteriophage DSS3_VP1]QGH74669.1 hypothetical protein DSS3VP1_00101 [Bacteriophage DSS3_VP1]